MKNKGFTLIELMGIMAVMAFMILLLAPAMTRIVKNADNDKIDKFNKVVILACESYVEANRDKFSNLTTPNTERTIKVNVIIDAGYLSKNLKDPITNFEITNNDIKISTLNNKAVICKYPAT